MFGFHTISKRKEPFFPQIFLPVKVFFTGTSGKNVFTGKPGLPEQRFTTLLRGLVYSITYTGRLGLSAGFLYLANTVSKICW